MEPFHTSTRNTLHTSFSSLTYFSSLDLLYEYNSPYFLPDSRFLFASTTLLQCVKVLIMRLIIY